MDDFRAVRAYSAWICRQLNEWFISQIARSVKLFKANRETFRDFSLQSVDSRAGTQNEIR